MVKSGQFTKSFANGIDVEFFRGSMENNIPQDPYYDVSVSQKETKLSLKMKKNANGYWGIEERTHLPSWVLDLEPQLIRAVKQNEA